MRDFSKKLIEVALPLPEINDASAYDKMPGIGPHPKGIHHWWARLPLPVSRAVLFASVVDDPSSHPEKFPTEEAQEKERERLFGIIRKMMQPQLHKHPEVYAEARAEMLKYCDGKLPPLLDPFAGGGSIPLEAARLGMEAYAGDINPVAVLLCKCYLELVPRWADWPPVNPEDRRKIGGKHGWRGSTGLAADVRYYGRVILERARERAGHFYPPVKVTAEMAAEHPHLKPYVGKELPVIAWIWARTVPSPNPAARGVHVPLMSTFWLSSKKGSEAWLEPVVDRAAGAWRFRVRTGAPPDREAVRAGTKTGRAMFRCLLTGDPIPDDYIRSEAKAGRLSARLVAIVAEGQRGRVYLPSVEEHERIGGADLANWRPAEPVTNPCHDVDRLPMYGMPTWADAFTPRQLTAMVTLSDLVREVRADVRRDALAAGLSDGEADAYTTAVTTFLALALDRCADFNNSLCGWTPSNQKVMHLFGRQAIPMVWDFAEANLLGDSVGGWSTCSDYVAKCIETTAASQDGHARPIDAASPWDGLRNVLVSTDPPYYDNIGYAALSDFFYVWLRRTIGDLYPDLFGTILVPKEPELVAAPERFDGDKRKAKEHFEQGFRRAFATLREKMDPRFPLTVYYAFKQDDEESGADEESGESENGNRVGPHHRLGDDAHRPRRDRVSGHRHLAGPGVAGVANARHGLERPRLLHHPGLPTPARRRPADRPPLLRGGTQARAARGHPAPPAGEHRPGGLRPGSHRPRHGHLLQVQPDPAGERPTYERAHGPGPHQPDPDRGPLRAGGRVRRRHPLGHRLVRGVRLRGGRVREGGTVEQGQGDYGEGPGGGRDRAVPGREGAAAPARRAPAGLGPGQGPTGQRLGGGAPPGADLLS